MARSPWWPRGSVRTILPRKSPGSRCGRRNEARMRFENVCIESLAVARPEEIWTSAQIEERLRPLYERLKWPAGRLELMTGIRERRMWAPGTRPSDASAAAGKAVLAKSSLPAAQVELFIHSA